MSQGYGIESPSKHAGTRHRQPARYLVLIDAAGSPIARLFLENREQVAEFDAASEEVAVMTSGLVSAKGAHGPQWDRALEGHSTSERDAAEIYTLDI